MIDYMSEALSRVPLHIRPILGGVLCGILAVFYPQTLFAGYSTLDRLITGRYHYPLPLLCLLLPLKLILSSFSLATGLVGGVFAPSIFFGAVVGSGYHQVLLSFISMLRTGVQDIGIDSLTQSVFSITTICGAPAYATVGAAATLGALFRAPLTASMLMFEITLNHDIVLPVLASAGLAGLFAEILSHPRKQW
eukprot:CAMPEP_0182440694 /NCGR_PEP_ID=MMETSP1167-20130531/87226_1 /TAXON_ID=2988 /ORGANISM="Mallomonas Sp, Strain CCMP3275" /LENGTH=192 /DNA_ID=CAMNT_0024634717 /DNA_START=1050 /DNA_END=1628 /DNA_ORIENTATION=-